MNTTTLNGHAPPGRITLPRFELRGPAMPLREESRESRNFSPAADRLLRWLTWTVVLAVAAFAAIVSYSHIYDLARFHGQHGAAALLLPLSVDGVIASASLVMLSAARRHRDAAPLARLMLWLGIAATVAANVAYGLPFGPVGAVVSAWPAVAFVGSVEMAVKSVRDDRDSATATDTPVAPPSDPPLPRQDSVTNAATAPRHEAPSRTRQKTASPRAKAAAILARHPDLTVPELAKRAGCSPKTAERARADAGRTLRAVN